MTRKRWPSCPAEVVAAARAGDDVTGAVVGIVSELTGYPPELLDLDLDLEADLGVDTVKQAEVFAAVRERYGVARDPTPVKLRDFPDPEPASIGWVRDKTGVPAPASGPAEALPPQAAPELAAPDVPSAASAPAPCRVAT